MTFLAALKAEIRRLQDRPFLEAAMAVCALSALSGGRVSLAERYQVDTLVATLDRLAIHDPHEAAGILDDFIFRVRQDADAVASLRATIRRYAGDAAASHALLRMAYLVITADEGISVGERAMFDDLCALLAVEPSVVLAELAGVGDTAVAPPR